MTILQNLGASFVVCGLLLIIGTITPMFFDKMIMWQQIGLVVFLLGLVCLLLQLWQNNKNRKRQMVNEVRHE